MEFRRAYTPKRWTFIIDKNGIITRIDTDVETGKDGENVYNFLKDQEY
jgi:peroxiredoxin